MLRTLLSWLVAAMPLCAQASWGLAPPTSLPSRQLASVAYDPDNLRVVVFSGDGLAPDTWSLTDGVWSDLTRLHRPPARMSGAMAYDPATGGMLLFGGSSTPGGANLLNDTWLLQGDSWVQLAPTTSPSARASHSMVYDEANSRIVMFGGHDAGGASQETWVWDGTDWALLASGGPSARSNFAMAYDRTFRNIVVFGGHGSSGPLGDTWVLGGSSWTLAQPASAPSARWGSRMTFDLNLGQVVLHGGLTSDTWAWSGSDWTLLQTSGPSLYVYNHALLFDYRSVSTIAVTGHPVSAWQQWHFHATPPLPASSTSFGSGCSGPSGTPSIAEVGGGAVIGGEATFVLSPAPFAGLFALGWSNASSQGVPLPWSLAQFGMPGCDLLVDPVVLMSGVSGAAASSTLTVPIPFRFSLVGQTLFSQGISLDPNANSAWLTVSEGVGVSFGWY